MKINKKLYFRLVYFMAGTIVIGILLTVVAFNFTKDSRLLHAGRWPEQSTQKQPATTGTTVQEDSGFDKVNYERPKDQVNTDSTVKKNTKDESGIPAKTKIQIINRSTVKSLTEQLRTTFEAGGFVVSAGNEQTNTTQSTIIIEWNNSKAGEKVQKILKSGKIVKQNDPSSRFDATLIIGDDYRP